MWYSAVTVIIYREYCANIIEVGCTEIENNLIKIVQFKSLRTSS